MLSRTSAGRMGARLGGMLGGATWSMLAGRVQRNLADEEDTLDDDELSDMWLPSKNFISD